MPRIRLSLRATVLAVAVAALLTRQIVLLWRIGSEPNGQFIKHIWEAEGGSGAVEETWCVAPFWARYWHRTFGLSWKTWDRCDCEDVRHAVKIFPASELDLSTPIGPIYRYAGTRRPSPDEAARYAATLQSLKTLGPAPKPGVGTAPGATP